MSPAQRGRRAVFTLVFLTSSSFALMADSALAAGRGGSAPSGGHAGMAPRMAPRMAPSMAPSMAPRVSAPVVRPAPAVHRPAVMHRPTVQPVRHFIPVHQRPTVAHRDRRGHWQRHDGRPDRHGRRPGLHYPRGGYGAPFVVYTDEAPLVETYGEPPVIPAYIGANESCGRPLIIHIGEGAGAQRAAVIHGQSSECGRPQIIHYNRPNVANVMPRQVPRAAHAGKKKSWKAAGKAGKRAGGRTVFRAVRARH